MPPLLDRYLLYAWEFCLPFALIGALVGFAAGATAMRVGVFRPVIETLRKPVIDSYGEELTLVNILPSIRLSPDG